MLLTPLLSLGILLLPAVTAKTRRQLGSVEDRQTAPITQFNIGPGFGNIIVAQIQPDGILEENGFLTDAGQWTTFEPDMGLFQAFNDPSTTDPSSTGDTITPVTITSSAGTCGFQFNSTTGIDVFTCTTPGAPGFEGNDEWINNKFETNEPFLAMYDFKWADIFTATAVPTTTTPQEIGVALFPVKNITLVWAQ